MGNTKRRILIAIAAVSLCVLLAATAYAVMLLSVQLRNNHFETGSIDVDIAYDEPPSGQISLFTPGLLYEPGMTVRGDFTVTNRSTDTEGIWCRLYFTGLAGPLARVMEARIYDGQTLLYSGRIWDWQRGRLTDDPFLLPDGGAKTLTLELHYPEAAGNETQGQTMEFALSVVAVQRSNNPGKLFH